MSNIHPITDAEWQALPYVPFSVAFNGEQDHGRGRRFFSRFDNDAPVFYYAITPKGTPRLLWLAGGLEVMASRGLSWPAELSRSPYVRVRHLLNHRVVNGESVPPAVVFGIDLASIARHHPAAWKQLANRQDAELLLRRSRELRAAKAAMRATTKRREAARATRKRAPARVTKKR